jgi:D-alanyl-lipoteichoic acid acyltransferase DltB (MBOAT superfamily)
MNSGFLLLGLAVYVLLCRAALQGLRGTLREVVFAFLNVAGFYIFFITGHNQLFTILFGIYLAAVIVMYAIMRSCTSRDGGGWRLWLSFITPIAALVAVRYTPTGWYHGFLEAIRGSAVIDPNLYIAPYFLGISYLAFRCSFLVLEVRNGVVPKPGFWEYIGFAFFVPTMPVGPINTYSNYRRGFAEHPPRDPLGRSALRILVGCVKYLFFGNVFNQLTYSGLLLDDHYHPWIDLPIAMLFYYIYLYCNFSGFCDIAIGMAGMIGIPVHENFQDPFASRNMREFWNRWHITLSQYMRDVVFAPLSKYLARVFGPENVNHAVAVTIMVVFLLMGIWHGTGWNYAVFGLLQGVGVITTHYYTLGLKKWLGRDGFKAYNANPWIRAVAVAITFCFFAATLFFFANSPKDIGQIIAALGRP